MMGILYKSYSMMFGERWAQTGKLQMRCMCGLGLRTPLLGLWFVDEEASGVHAHSESRSHHRARKMSIPPPLIGAVLHETDVKTERRATCP
jgi:hypothetical protein